MTDKTLSEDQKIIVAQKLSQAIINKQNPHPADLTRAALILYDLNRLGYNAVDYVIDELIEITGKSFSETMREELEAMANAYSYLVSGMNDQYYAKSRITEDDLQ